MKVLIHSNAPWAATGYGQQTQQLARQLQADGHEVAISAFYGLSGAMQVWEGIPVFPGGVDPYGNDVLVGHAQRWFGGEANTGLVITLVDAWVLRPEVLRQLNVAMWTPVDHDPCPPRVIDTIKASGALPVAMSRHGLGEFEKAGLDAMYAPHGIDTTLYSPGDRAESRKVMGLPEGGFVVGMVAANKGQPSRKGFGEAFQAFARFQARHKDAILYMHTELTGVVQGVNLDTLAQSCGIPGDRIAFVHQYTGFVLGFPLDRMPHVYRSLDVLLNPSYGEGFGIPILEAQACGRPVIVTDTTAMTEVGKTGWQVPGQRFWTNQESWMTVPNVDKIHWALEQAYTKAGRLKDQARSHAGQYDATRVYDQYWKPILDRMSGPKPVEEPLVEKVAA